MCLSQVFSVILVEQIRHRCGIERGKPVTVVET